MRRRNTLPTATDAPQLSFWLKPCVSEAQQSALETKAGKSPLLLKFKNFVMAFTANSDRSGAVQSTAC